MADDRIEDLKEMLHEAEEERAAKKREYKLRIQGLELMIQGKVGEARKIHNTIAKGRASTFYDLFEYSYINIHYVCFAAPL